MTPAQVDHLLGAEHRLSAPADPSQRAQDAGDVGIDLVALANRARKAR